MNLHALLTRVVAATALLLAPPWAAAQAPWPQKPINLWVGVQPGGSSDAVARMIAKGLSERLRQQVVVSNKPGASTRLGFDHIQQSAPDGYTIGLMYAQATIFHLMFDGKKPLAAGKDFTPISMLARSPTFLAVPATSSNQTLGDLLRSVKSAPHRPSFGHAGSGSNQTLATYKVLTEAGTSATPVAYKGGGPLAIALARGEVDFGPLDYASARPLLERGSVRLLAIMEPKRSSLMPDVPSTLELGMPADISGSPWYMLVGPAGLSPDVTNTLSRHVNEILQENDVRNTYASLDIERQIMTPEQAAGYFDKERVRMSGVIESLGISLRQQ